MGGGTPAVVSDQSDVFLMQIYNKNKYLIRANAPVKTYRDIRSGLDATRSQNVIYNNEKIQKKYKNHKYLLL